MRDLWKKIWYSEPVVFVGALTATWAAIVAFDQATDEFTIPVWVYFGAIAVTIFLTAITRQQVTPTE